MYFMEPVEHAWAKPFSTWTSAFWGSPVASSVSAREAARWIDLRRRCAPRANFSIRTSVFSNMDRALCGSPRYT